MKRREASNRLIKLTLRFSEIDRRKDGDIIQASLVEGATARRDGSRRNPK
jgi:hypothetical protein